MRQDRAETTRKQILDAAMECFARQGYDGVSTAAIAKAAGVSQGIIFHHFSTKEGLFSAIVRTGVDAFKECVARAEQSQLSPVERIQFLIRLVGEMTLTYPHRTDIILRQVFSMRLDLEKIEGYGFMEVISAIRDAFEEGKQSGAFADIDTQTAALSVLGIYVANYVGWSMLGKTYDFIHALGRACSMFIEGVVRR
ncbi:MAG: TetR/AcrR family transcriptional regulator [Deltaproteobacteria bacterium]|nr:TetR/AcrR family transcriptional regulator [Deltaproteobacteria bacterium]